MISDETILEYIRVDPHHMYGSMYTIHEISSGYFREVRHEFLDDPLDDVTRRIVFIPPPGGRANLFLRLWRAHNLIREISHG